jgi:hypothetical protein
MKELEALLAQIGCHQRVPGHVSARPGETRDQTDADRVTVGAKNDRDRGGSFLGGKPCRRAGRHDHIDLLAHQVCSEIPQAFGVSVRRPALNDDVFSVHITEFRKLAHEGHGEGRTEAGIEQPNFGTLLCAACLRPGSYRATDQRNEVAPPHVGHQDLLLG